MRKFIVGTVIAMVVSLGTLTAQGITAHAAEMMTASANTDGYFVCKEFGDDVEAKELTDEMRENLRNSLKEDAEKEREEAKKSKMSAYEAYKAKNTEDWSKISNIFGF